MKMQIILSVLMALICVKVNGQTTHKSTVSPPHEFKCMKEFYQKYCAEKDDNVFKQLEKCEHKNPKEIKDIEIHCVEKIRKAAGKTGELTHLEYQALECDAKLGEEFEKCMNASLTNEKMVQLEKKYPSPQLDNIARDIMNCDCDVYKIPHD